MTDISELNEANRRFLDELKRRRPEDALAIDRRIVALSAAMPVPMGVALEAAARPAVNVVLETIVSEERPVLFTKAGGIDFEDVPHLSSEARALVETLRTHEKAVALLLPLVGRINVAGFAGGIDYLGTGWFIDETVVVTNRHVASLVAQWNGREFVFTAGAAGRPIGVSLGIGHEKGDTAVDPASLFKVVQVLYIEPPGSEHDIAFLRVDRASRGLSPKSIPVAAGNAAPSTNACVIGYPAEGDPSAIPDQALMRRLYQSQYNVKRIAPGLIMRSVDAALSYDNTTLGGCSGAVVLDPATGAAVGLHFAGIWRERNLAVPASVLRDFIARRRWLSPPSIETQRSDASGAAATNPTPSTAAATPASPISVTVPMLLTLTIGATSVTGTAALTGAASVQAPATSPDALEQAVRAFWKQRPPGVIAVRAGFLDQGMEIGGQPCIAASVRPDQWRGPAAHGPAEFEGFPVRYDPADVHEQVETLFQTEAITGILYDDDNRTGDAFSFETVVEPMRLLLHVGPEYSWEVLGGFLGAVKKELVSGIYEFHGLEIKNAIEARLDKKVDVRIVMDNVTFSEAKHPEEEFDREAVFKSWRTAYPKRFHGVVVKEGKTGLVARAYHIKVSVADGKTVWLSSGNWKQGSSQPVITKAMRDNATAKDLPGNREWHVVIDNKTLATRFRAHIRQDFDRSTELGGKVVAEAALPEALVDIPILAMEGAVLERKPPSKLLKPLAIDRSVRVRPLLTPDRRGAVYSEAVLELMRSARESLLFQIPYIGMPANPDGDRGYIDELIAVLTAKLKSLPDARVLLRAGGSELSSPTHAAWHFKSRGVDIDTRLRQIDNHHTKGMIVDGQRVLIGSHNWSGEGVSLNRDASLIFHDSEIAGYYAEAFAIDWARARPISAKKAGKAEATILPAQGAAPPPGYRRVALSALLSGDA